MDRTLNAGSYLVTATSPVMTPSITIVLWLLQVILLLYTNFETKMYHHHHNIGFLPSRQVEPGALSSLFWKCTFVGQGTGRSLLLRLVV